MEMIQMIKKQNKFYILSVYKSDFEIYKFYITLDALFCDDIKTKRCENDKNGMFIPINFGDRKRDRRFLLSFFS